MITLRLIDADDDNDIAMLYALLTERTPEQAISHKKMPSFGEHIEFVKSDPYRFWYAIIEADGNPVGCIYLTHNNEVGISLFNYCQGYGYGSDALTQLMEKHADIRPLYANINPQNKPSIGFFTGFGFELLQQTYILKD